MKKRILQDVSLVLVLSLLASCATTQTGVQDPSRQTAPNSAERDILVQDVATGAIIGGAVGAAAGAAASSKDHGKYALIGALAGAIVGGIVGYVVARQQILTYRNIQLKNERLAKLLETARKYNSSVASYNISLEQDIAQMKTKTKVDQEKIAKEKLKQAEDQKMSLARAIDERQKLSETLIEVQKVQYQATLNDLDNENNRLEESISELRKLSEPARIGSLIMNINA